MGVGITVMKSLAAGNLLKAETSPFGMALTPVQCIQYVSVSYTHLIIGKRIQKSGL